MNGFVLVIVVLSKHPPAAHATATASFGFEVFGLFDGRLQFLAALVGDLVAEFFDDEPLTLAIVSTLTRDLPAIVRHRRE